MKLSVATTRRENLLGFGYWLISLFVLPSLLFFAGDFWGISLSGLNILLFVINFACVAGIFHKFLWASLKTAWKHPFKTLWCVAKGLLVYYALTFLVTFLIFPWLGPNFSNLNDDAILELAKENTGLFVFCTVCLVPVTEEMFYRGLLFQGFFRKNRIFALCLSVFLFAAIHVLDYIGSADLLTLLGCFAQYLPAGLALVNAYMASDTIAAPMLMHIVINLIAVITQMR